ncbi:folate receptor family protein [Anaeramoeba flamelloides]|uniref:Folate receptor family protein n=1 Tax=Anaeramoeba flamelloides TaxID=1746091 RepID=A0ABQ8XJ83_9EUKA|nr:folate receptor family protein [Anaeramoeba flamelloides]
MSIDPQTLPDLPNNTQVPQNMNNPNMMNMDMDMGMGMNNQNMLGMNNDMNMDMNMNTDINMTNMMNINTNNNMNMVMGMNNQNMLGMNNNMNMNNNKKQPTNEESTSRDMSRTNSSSDSESDKKTKKKQIKSKKKHRNITIGFILIFILVIVLVSIDFGDSNENPMDGEHHGKGSPGLPCPPSEYYLDKTAEREVLCCDWYDNTCGKDIGSGSDVCRFKRDYNEILNDKSSKCTDYLGLISCAPVSPYANYFAPNISIGSNYQQMDICDTFCDTVYEECKSALLSCYLWNSFPDQHCNEKVEDHYSDGKSFCEGVILLNYTTDHDHCFGPAGIFKSNIFLMMFIIGFFAFFWD